MKVTRAITKKEVVQNWHLIDADGKVLGSTATEIAHLLMGKHKATYVPYMNSGDKVVVINSAKVVLTGNKDNAKLYRSHSGYVGNLRTHTAAQVRKSNPNRMIREAVKGMLPKNRLRDVRLADLYIYPDAEHPHQGQLKTN